MTIPIRSTTLVLSLAWCSATLPAQAPVHDGLAPSQPGQNKIILDVVVTPKSGKPVAGLEKQDFTVLDNNVAQPIASFQALAGPQAPIQITLIIDAVNTNYTSLAYEREQVDKFLKSNGGHLAHSISLAIFTDTGTQIQQAGTTDGNQLSASLDNSPTGLRQIHRDTQYEGEDRLNLSLNALQLLIDKEATLPGRKIIFWVSPGWPLLSSPRVDLDSKQQQQLYAEVVNISTMLRRNNITLYSIDPLGSGQGIGWEFAYQEYLSGLKKTREAQIGDLALQVIATQSGGLALSASNDIASQIQHCMDDMDAYYRISYNAPPSEHPGKYHRIDVRVSQPGLIARTRTGYYANP